MCWHVSTIPHVCSACSGNWVEAPRTCVGHQLICYYQSKCEWLQAEMENPVVAADGQTYDRASIQQWFDTGSRTSPLSGAPLSDTMLRPNYSIRSAIRDWQQKQSHAA